MFKILNPRKAAGGLDKAPRQAVIGEDRIELLPFLEPCAQNEE